MVNMTQLRRKPEPDPRPDFLTYQRHFVDYLRDPDGNGHLSGQLPEQIGIYVRLMHNKFEDSLRTCFPVCRELLGTAHWHRLVSLFVQEHRCESPLYREIPDEFIDYLLNGKPGLVLPDFLREVAHFEWMELVLETAQDELFDSSLESTDLFAAVPVINPVLSVLTYRYPVHTIMPGDDSWPRWQNWQQTVPVDVDTPVYLFGIRDGQYRVQFMETNQATIRLVELLQDGFRTGKQAVSQLALELRPKDHIRFLEFCHETLNRFQQQSIIVGTKHE